MNVIFRIFVGDPSVLQVLGWIYRCCIRVNGTVLSLAIACLTEDVDSDGAGHGPSSHHFGLRDQVLEMRVMLASGETVIANTCQNNDDLFMALRGGGGGTYGVVISTTNKPYPTHPILAHNFAVIPLNANLRTLLNVSADIVSKYPLLSDGGFSSYGAVAPSSLLGLPI
ncbi:hypothetical protein BBP40_000776 [Aspergillus hancockii]|nr:hypothetical protein BBP40_000776 [Aspergillus hancockii]